MAPMSMYVMDLAAFGWFLVAFVGYSTISGTQWAKRRSIVGAVQAQREAWMRNMAGRENRVVDTVLLGSLSQGNAFFASTSAIAVGGLSTMLGSGQKAQVMIEQLPYATAAGPVLFELKVILMIALFIYAFFKFAWAFRLSHYTAIMIGATPVSVPGAVLEAHTVRHVTATAKLIGIAAEHANAGLRTFYCAMAAGAWFYHPLLFIAATGWVLVILIRRDFASRSRSIIASATFS